MSVDYKNTVYLPKTDFPMKAGLNKREPQLLERWKQLDLYKRLREDAKGREKFILHDGPPYANGNLHIGHALNKILKDVIVRSQQMLGKDSNYVPGWDCHGLPIEWKIEEKYRKKGDNKDEVPIAEFRQECREFAEHWIDIQREEFQRLGIEGDWDNPYTTMTYPAEAQIVRELGKFLMNGSLYRGAKPVMWSVVEKTALAEAEIEYHDHTSNTIFVRFKVTDASKSDKAKGADIVIWTTTPWTIPGNRALAYSADDSYARVKITGVSEDALSKAGDEIVVAEALLGQVVEEAGITSHEVLDTFKGRELAGTICQHPFNGQGYDFEVPLLPADFVEMDTGSGFVHIAPGHGADDWELGIANDIAVPDTVGGDGLYFDHVPLFAGHHVFKADEVVMEAMKEVGALLAHGKISHSYPHSWRSKAPLIFRNTPQWFISMDSDNLRDKALRAIKDTAFYPASGRNRLQGMIETRPDWCVSRQRAWGVPITVFVNKESGEVLRDQAVMDRIVEAVEAEGADAWFASDMSRFLGPDLNPDDFEQITDILDVWFDSGSTHSFVLEQRDDLQWPASLYLEGSDQHRGWFHSSLLESCGTRGRAPYDAVLTHGFVMAEDGQKMSKSLGNITAPQEVVEQHGADILRLWVVGSDYSDDLRIGKEIIKHHSDIYRRLRNTLRFLLGNLNDFDEAEKLPVNEMPELDRWALHRIHELDAMIRKACDTYEFHSLFTELHNFCAVDLSAFYLDIRKDALYCDQASSTQRRAARTVLDQLFNCLTAWFAPFICFTAEEAWLARFPDDNDSVHLRLFPEIPGIWKNDKLAAKWSKIRDLRRVVTGALEIERAEKRIGSSLQAAPTVYVTADYIEAMNGLDLAEIAITSTAELTEGDVPEGAFTIEDVKGIGVQSALAPGEKCIRCYKVLPEVGTIAGHDEVCVRCAEAADQFPVAAE
ncbi:MAG: isoleucine--tRNA ligase [Rhodospirillaceae bacterium]|nr:isoleucine--tRNA ligase [Rhodospirillaceae bacterium]MBT7269013.1 isoleucine--tRNA ligase [Rhodospirillaceae bacterium]